jgi:hypothetical protein
VSRDHVTIFSFSSQRPDCDLRRVAEQGLDSSSSRDDAGRVPAMAAVELIDLRLGAFRRAR